LIARLPTTVIPLKSGIHASFRTLLGEERWRACCLRLLRNLIVFADTCVGPGLRRDDI
jgi:hypothetical protein